MPTNDEPQTGLRDSTVSEETETPPSAHQLEYAYKLMELIAVAEDVQLGVEVRTRNGQRATERELEYFDRLLKRA
jgi:hypothetical protein